MHSAGPRYAPPLRSPATRPPQILRLRWKASERGSVMVDPSNGDRRPRRPAMFSPGALDAHASGGVDPAEVSEIAHESAAVLVGTGRATHDPDVTRRLVRLVDELGMATVAQLWAAQ